MITHLHLPPADGASLPRLLAISGSLRRASHSTALLRALAPLVGDSAQIDLATLNDVPPYDGDLEGDALPAPVAELKAAIAAADGLVVASPEYNYGIPGVLKNAIDWASRPGFASPLKGKPVLIITNSPFQFGGVRAQAQIRDAFSATLALPVTRAHLAVPGIDKKIADGRISDDVTAQLLRSGIDELLAQIGRR